MKLSKATDSKKVLFLFRLTLLILFVALARLASQLPYFGRDLEITHFWQSIQSPYIFSFLNFVSALGNGLNLVFLIVLTSIGLFTSGYLRESFVVSALTLTGVTVGSLAKTLVNRPRPDTSLIQIQEFLSDKSFPSLHVLMYTVFFGYLFYLAIFRLRTRWLRWTLALTSFLLILTIGISRIYLGAHWASDTLGGYLLGAFILTFIPKSHANR